MSKLDAGQITVTLDGEEVVLKPTIAAAKNISRLLGGFQAAHQALFAQNLDAYVTVVRHGLGMKTEAEAKGLEDRVFRTGLRALVGPLTDFILILANGGRPLEEAAEGEGEGKDAA